MNRKSVFLILAGLMIGAGLGMLILISLGTNLSPEGKDSPPSQGLAVPHGGYTAHDFELFTLSGERIRLSNLQGKSVLLNFSAFPDDTDRTRLPKNSTARISPANCSSGCVPQKG